MSDYVYHQVQGGPALKACKAFESLARERFRARQALAESCGAIGAVRAKGQWGLWFDPAPGPGWTLLAQVKDIKIYQPDPDTPEGRTYLTQLADLHTPDCEDLAELLGWRRDDPRRPVAHHRLGLGWVIITPFDCDPALPPVPGAVRRIDESEFNAGLHRPMDRRMAS